MTITGVEQLRADEVEIIDDHTIAFHFERPRTDYLFVHAGRGSMYVYSKAQYDAEGLEGYEDDTILEMIEAIAASIDPEERDRLIRDAFTYTYEQYTDLPMTSIAAEVTVDPAVVADWVSPGVTSTGLSHWHLIRAAND